MKREQVLKFIIALSVIGLGISLYSFLHKFGVASGEFCTVGETFNCDIVNNGPYSEFLGIPVALLGVLGYFMFGLAAYLKLREPSDLGVTVFLVTSTLGGFGFSLYLTYIEAFVLETYCMLCLASQLVMFLIFGSAFWLLHQERIGRKFELEE